MSTPLFDKIAAEVVSRVHNMDGQSTEAIEGTIRELLRIWFDDQNPVQDGAWLNHQNGTFTTTLTELHKALGRVIAYGDPIPLPGGIADAPVIITLKHFLAIRNPNVKEESRIPEGWRLQIGTNTLTILNE